MIKKIKNPVVLIIPLVIIIIFLFMTVNTNQSDKGDIKQEIEPTAPIIILGTIDQCGMFCDSSGDYDIIFEDWSPGIGCVLFEPLIDTGSGGWNDDAGGLCNTYESVPYCPNGTSDCWYSAYPAWDEDYDGDEWPDATCCVLCGDGVINGNEICDPGESTYDPDINSYYPYSEALNGETCASQVGSAYTGNLNCNNQCSGYDTSECIIT